MSVQYLVGDVFDRMADLDDGSVDLILTSPPFLALRSYLPADHPDKDKEIGSETTPAEYIDTLVRLTAEWRRVLAPHGSIAIELGDTYSGSGGAGGDYAEAGLREGQPMFRQGTPRWDRSAVPAKNNGGPGWPLDKSKCLIPELYRIALVYGINPLTGAPSPGELWRARNVVTWCRPNPPPGRLSDKWRPATSDIVVACLSDKRYWDDLATRRPLTDPDRTQIVAGARIAKERFGGREVEGRVMEQNPAGAPLLDYWELTTGGYKGAHYAMFPPGLVVPFIKAMCPEKVCVECGKPSRRIVDIGYRKIPGGHSGKRRDASEPESNNRGLNAGLPTMVRSDRTLGWSDCGHDNWRPGLVLDPFAGTGTTLAVAHGHGRDAIGIDIDSRSAELAVDRVGPMFLEVVA